MSLAAIAAAPPAPATDGPTYRIRPIEDRVLAAVQERRAAVGVPALDRREVLDRVARQRAEHLAALPEDRRLAEPWYVDDALTRAGVRGWSRTYQRQAVLTGERPVERIVEQWSRLPEAWKRAMDRETTAVGVGGAHAQDGTYLFAAVLVVELDWPDDPREFERRVFDAVNDIRREHGLPPLTADPTLAAVARAHSEAMRDRDFFDHVDPDGTVPGERVEAAGIGYRTVAENLGFSQRVDDPVARAIRNWMGSPGHRANVLEPAFRRSGVGVAVSDDGGMWATQLFVEPERERGRSGEDGAP